MQSVLGKENDNEPENSRDKNDYSVERKTVPNVNTGINADPNADPNADKTASELANPQQSPAPIGTDTGVSAQRAGLTLVTDNTRSSSAGPSALSSRRYQYLAARQSTLLRVVAEFVDQPSLASGLAALAGELQQRFRCERVVVGLCRFDQIKVAAISQQSSVNEHAGEVLLLGEAMQEACEQDALVEYPARRESPVIVEGHQRLAAGMGEVRLCTVPVCANGEVVGALLFQASLNEAWSPLTIELLKQVADTLAPMILLRQSAEAGIRQLIRRKLERAFSGIIKPTHLMRKLVCLLLAGALVLTAFIPVTHRLTADAQLISTERRLITAPVSGYIASVDAKVGDKVNAGQPLVSLDVRDLALQIESLDGQISNAGSELRSAMASHDRKEMAVAQAQLDQARAERRLLQNQIERARILAPINGVIISGDLSQMIGAPVQRGDTLLEMAPAQGYEIQLLVDEADIAYAEAGLLGELSLHSNPGQVIEFLVYAVHPIAVAADGATRFQLDALPVNNPDGLRPGQTGVARLAVGKQSMLWVWTHKFVEWARQSAWRWLH